MSAPGMWPAQREAVEFCLQRPAAMLDMGMGCGKTRVAIEVIKRREDVRRGAGKLVRDGREVAKPTVRLCGSGNASGCHGLAHAGMLHFRWASAEHTDRRTGNVLVGGHWEYLTTEEPTKYQMALAMGGWRRL